MMGLKQAISMRLGQLGAFAGRHLVPLLFLGIRLKVGSVFLLSGWLKLGYVFHGETDTLYFIFEYYKVPLLPSHMAAWLCMAGELAFGLMLAAGLFARIGALGLIFISGVIYHTDGNPQAVYWALLLAVIAVMGPEKWSLDRLVQSRGTTPALFDKPLTPPPSASY